MLVGNSKKITVKSAEGGKFVGEVTWTSSDKKVAIVDKSGNVTGIKQGSCH
ncbi:MAG: Ig-like domain-containing protein [Anaerocolumna aminovalerica]|nr:Ig-like domain-containing protein [Anaerocolumna aminovalerica]